MHTKPVSLLKYVAAALVMAGAIPAHAADSKACATAKKYIELIQTGAFETIGDLWAKESVFHTPLGTQLHGKEAIGNYYKTRIKEAKLILRGQDYIGDDTHCFFEIWHKSKLNADGKYVTAADGEYHRGAADHFIVDKDGLIVEMAAYPSPAALPLGGAAGK